MRAQTSQIAWNTLNIIKGRGETAEAILSIEYIDSTLGKGDFLTKAPVVNTF